MKKIISLSIISILTLFFFAGKAQVTVFSNNLETWNGNVPVGLVGAKTTVPASNINPYTISAHSPSTSCKLENTTSTHMRFSTQAIHVTSGTVYTVSYWVRGHGDIRLGLFDGRAGNGYATYGTYTTVNSSSWAQITETVTAATDTAKAEFILSFRNTNADIDHLQVDDIVITRPGIANPSIIIYSPAEGATIYSADVPVAFDVSEFVVGNPGTGIDGHINYTIDGGAAQSHYTILPINLTGLSAISHQVILQLVDNSDAALTPNKADTVNFTVNLTLPNPQTIHAIQYSTSTPANSPFVNTVTSTSGIITAVAPTGYFMQDGTGSWNGIYVYDNLHHPVIGDNVAITGTVKEYYGYTEFASLTGFTILSSGQALPAPTTVTGANIADTTAGEAYEGVLVEIINASCTKIANSYGEWTVFDTDSAFIDDLMFHYTPILGTHYDVTGVIYLTFGADFIEPRDAADVQIHSGINEMTQNNFSVYPNPVSSTLFVKDLENVSNIEVADITGRILLNNKVSGTTASIGMSNLSEGTYFVRFINNGVVVSAKTIVKK